MEHNDEFSPLASVCTSSRRGAGVWVAPGWVLTAWHGVSRDGIHSADDRALRVPESASGIKVQLRGEQIDSPTSAEPAVYFATAEATGPGESVDLALVELRGNPLWLRLAARVIAKDDLISPSRSGLIKGALADLDQSSHPGDPESRPPHWRKPSDDGHWPNHVQRTVRATLQLQLALSQIARSCSPPAPGASQ